jgi:inner membrane protein
MDSITHIVIGAAIGETFAGKSLGKRAMFFGAVAHSLPDIDVVASFWLPPADNLLAHRGITHSFLFATVTTIVIAWLLNSWYRRKEIPFIKWIAFLGVCIFLHLLLDSTNSYGTGFFEPFSHKRFAFNILFVADPFFFIAPGVVFIVLLVTKSNNDRRRLWAGCALLISLIYFLIAFQNKRVISQRVDASLSSQGVQKKRYFTTPTVLNSFLWCALAEVDSGFYIGYSSIFDQKKSVDFNFFPRQDFLLDEVEDTRTVSRLKQFSQGYYTVGKVDSTLVFSDLRFGQANGWSDPHAPFTFRWYLQKPEDNLLVIQRGRFSGWNKEVVRSLIDRIKGN